MLTRERPKAATKRGRRTLLAGVVAVALLGGMTVSVASAGVAGALPTQTLKVCKAGDVSGSFTFSVNEATPFSLTTGNCRIVGAKAGHNTVTEALDSTGATHFTHATTMPANALVSVVGQTATVNVTLGGTAEVSMFNAPVIVGLEVCKVAADATTNGHTFNFTESTLAGLRASFSLTALQVGSVVGENCSTPTNYPVGTHVTVTELGQSPFTLTSISPTANVSLSNVVLGTAGAGGSATVTVHPTAAGTADSIVTFTNADLVPPTPGVIKVCKYGMDHYVQGTFNFSLSGVAGSLPSMSIPVGQCSYDAAPVGQVTVTEAANPPYRLDHVSPNAVATNIDNGEATFNVQANTITEADFYNATRYANVEVCKTLSDTSAALEGFTFVYNVNDVLGTQTVSLTAASQTGVPACVTDPLSLPAGTLATITEVAQPDIAVTGVSVYPSAADAGSSLAQAVLTVGGPDGTSDVLATFTNQAYGYVEVCKNAADPSTGNQSFPFVITGGSLADHDLTTYNVTILAGQCSGALSVPLGTASINEIQANPNFYLANVTAVGGNPSQDRLLSSPTQDPALVSVVWGGVANETLATFTDAVHTGIVKICSGQLAALQTSLGQFSYAYSYTVNGTPFSSTFTLTNYAGGATACAEIGGPLNPTQIPVVNADGSAVMVSITATSATPNLVVDSASYQGAGMPITIPPMDAAPPVKIVFTVGYGTNSATFIWEPSAGT